MADQWSGQGRGWRYVARTINGSGTPGQWIDNELPLLGVSITDVLSGPPQLTGSIRPVLRRLLDPRGEPMLGEWGCEIYAEQYGEIRGGGILVNSDFDGPEWALDVSGYSGYAHGMGYESEQSFVDADPLDVVRHIWTHIQSGQNSNLGLLVDAGTHTPVRVGTSPSLSADDPQPAEAAADEGPYRLTWWANDDLGEEIDKLAKATPFEYHEWHSWNDAKTDIAHHLDFGYPTIGQRSPMRFVLGENVMTIPKLGRDGGNFSNHVRFLGAGEGSAMVRGEARAADGRLRRMVTVDDQRIQDRGQAQMRARDELARRLSMTGVQELVILDTQQTPVGAIRVGDDIQFQADEVDWLDLSAWHRVLSKTYSPENPEICSLKVMRTDGFAP